MRDLPMREDALPLSDSRRGEPGARDEPRVQDYYGRGYGVAARPETAVGLWDSKTMHACVCDSSWAVGLGANETPEKGPSPRVAKVAAARAAASAMGRAGRKVQIAQTIAEAGDRAEEEQHELMLPPIAQPAGSPRVSAPHHDSIVDGVRNSIELCIDSSVLLPWLSRNLE